ncbi:MAG: T9SS type A sorting domain-containing protein [Parafilimonas sp.]|nr:T9SS type A sorting domain-containing protein [Parafilimonas sp.]
MKLNCTLLNSILLSCTFLITFKASSQSVNTQDSLALVDIYNNTGGLNWTSNTNWLTTQPVSTWFGVTVAGGRVTQLIEYSNNLTGTLPSSIGRLTGLQLLSLGFNNLSGSIPDSIGNLSSLQTLLLTFNQFTGTIPETISNLHNLIELDLYKNQLSGTIPQSLARLANLTNLELQYNNLTGNIPDSIFTMHALVNLQLEYNQLSGHLSPLIGRLSNIVILYLQNNQFSGPIPDSLCNLPLLSDLDLSNNQFSGSIPANFGNLTNLHDLWLFNNQLSGKLPASFGNLTNLNALSVANNKLTGNLTGFKNLTGLGSFDISYNRFSQTTNIAFDASQFPYLRTIIMNNNAFTFSGLEALLTTYHYKCTYSPQAPIKVHNNGSALSVSAGGTLSNNTYTWYKVGTSGSTVITGDSVFHPASSGQYYVWVKNSIAVKLTLKSDTVNYTMPVAKAGSNSATVSFYPNPAKNNLLINGLDAAVKNTLNVTDASGHVYLSVEVKKSSAYNLNISSLHAGNYLLTIESNTTVRSYNFIKE